jgi:hypothetical protein
MKKCLFCQKNEMIVVKKPVRVIFGDCVYPSHNEIELGLCMECIEHGIDLLDKKQKEV